MRVALFVSVVASLVNMSVLQLRADAWSDAIEKLHAGDRAGAIQLLRGAIAKDPAAVRPNVLLVEVLLGGQQLEEARKVSDQALAKGPNVAEFHRVAGDVLFRQGYVFESEKEYRAAVHIDPNDARALLGAAQVFQSASINHKAALLIHQAYNLDPDDPVIGAALDQVEGDSPAAVARWEQLLKTLPLGEAGYGGEARGLTWRISQAKKLGGKIPNELASPYGHYQIPLVVQNDGRRAFGLGLSITVNDAKGELQLDTGAGGLLISSKLAERAGVERLADVDLGGIGSKGPVRGWLGYAEHIRIGDLELRNCIVRVSEKGSVNDSGGLLGTDLFQRFLVKLDFRQRRIELDPLPGPAWDGHTPVDRYAGPELNAYDQFLRFRHYIVLPTRISDGPPVLFLVDTGSGLNMISTTAAPSVTKLRDDPRKRVKGVSGEVKMVYSADKVTLEFARYRQVNQDLTAFDLSHLSRTAGAEITGILGLPLLGLFDSITLDYRDGRIKFDKKN